MAEGEDPAEAASAKSVNQGRRKPVTIDLAAETAVQAAETGAPAAKRSESERSNPAEPPRATDKAAPAGTVSDADFGVALPPPRHGSPWALLGFAILGGLVVVIAGYLLMFTDILPAPGANDAEEAKAEAQEVAADLAALQQVLAAQSDELGAAIGAIPTPDLSPLEQRLAALETAVATLPPINIEVERLAAAAAALGDAIDTEQAARQELVNTVEALRRETVAVAAAAGDPAAAIELSDEINALSARLIALENAGVADEVVALQSAIAEIGVRLDAFEAAATPDDLAAIRLDLASVQSNAADLNDRVAALSADAASRNQSEATARRLAVVNLRNAASGDEPFLTQLTILTDFGVDPDLLQPIEAAAVAGVPSRSTLEAEFSEAADAILAADRAADSDANFLERLLQNARDAVVVVPNEPVDGDDAPAIVSRMRAAVEDGDLVAALAERLGLTEESLAASEIWASRAAARVALDEEVDALDAAIVGRGAE